MKNILIALFALTATFSFGQTIDSTDNKKVPWVPDRIEYAVQIASTANLELLMQKPKFHEQVIDTYEFETACLKEGNVVYRVLIPAEDLADAYEKHSYYRRTMFRDCFIVTFKNGVRIN